MTQEKKEEKKIDNKSKNQRQIIIETNGNDIKIIKAEVAGNLEMIAILQVILNRLQNS